MKGFQLIDRFTGKDWPLTQTTGLVGTLILSCNEPTWLNGVRIDRSAYLVPLPDGKFSLTDAHANEFEFSDWNGRLLPVKHEKDSYLGFRNQLKDLAENMSPNGEWLKVSPWIIKDLKHVQPNHLDLILKRYLWHLEEVSRRPQTRLTIEIERMPVSRARRIPARAYPYLASHTEDWEHRKLTTVIPHKILSTLPDDLLNFYENRLVARLIYDFFIYLRGRLQELDAIREGLGEANPELGTHQRQQRVFRLMGYAIDYGEFQNRTQATRQLIEDLYARSVVLLNSKLFKAISPQERSQIPDEVRYTNILVNDRNYQFINVLWKELLSFQNYHRKTLQEITYEQQELCNGFQNFCLLLVHHALKNLGFVSEEQGTQTNSTVTLTGACGRMELYVDDCQNILLKQDSQVLVRFLPLASKLLSVPHQFGEHISEIQSRLVKHKKRSSANPENKDLTIILYPGQKDDVDRLQEDIKWQAITIGPDLHSHQQFGLLLVSSYLPGSVERVGRAVRWALWSKLFRSYPPRISLPATYERHLLAESSGWLASTDKHGVASVLRLPTEKETRIFKDYLHQKVGELQSGGLKKHKLDLHYISQSEASLEQAIEGFAALYTCPICQQPARAEDFIPRGQGNFICHCRNSDCRNTEWGLRRCGACGENYPYLIQEGKGLILPKNLHPGWLDDIFGMDVLSAPCFLNPLKWEFRCPHCGACPSAQNQAACLSCVEVKKEKTNDR